MESLDILEQRIDALISAHQELQKRVRELEEETQRLREQQPEVEELRREVQALREERENLKGRLVKLVQQLEAAGVV